MLKSSFFPLSTPKRMHQLQFVMRTISQLSLAGSIWIGSLEEKQDECKEETSGKIRNQLPRRMHFNGRARVACFYSLHTTCVFLKFRKDQRGKRGRPRK